MGLHRRLVWKVAKGFRGRAGSCIKIARQQAEKALQHAYRGRKEKKREVRALWITRINAGAREHGVRRRAWRGGRGRGWEGAGPGGSGSGRHRRRRRSGKPR
jgi:hypothetical protein